jgi:hypothetical protein
LTIRQKCHIQFRKSRSIYSTAQIQRIGWQSSLVQRAAGIVFPNESKRGVGEIAVENLPETAALFGHGLCAALTEADAVTLAGTFQDHLPALLA